MTRAIAAMVWFLGCHKSAESLPDHTLAFGGDVSLGRSLNAALYDDQARGRILGDLPWLPQADLTLVNAEGVMAGGGRYYDKGESRPHEFHVDPIAVDVLKDAGVDLVTIGNNHANDYGPLALQEELDRLLLAGMDYVGGGADKTDARRPAYRQVGDTVVAFVGGDLTYAENHQATDTTPGTLWLPGIEPKKKKKVLKELAAILADARTHADLVFFSPHWGDNFVAEPTEHTQDLAHEILSMGFDGIFAHSAHWIQGVALVDGKPVIYDAGDIVNDYPAPKEAERAVVYVIHFNRAGVTSIEAHPALAQQNRTSPARGKGAIDVLDTLEERTKKLGTQVVRTADMLTITCDPGGIVPRPDGATAPARTPPPAVRTAPQSLMVEALPSTATPATVVFENGVTLVGYEVLVSKLRVPKAGNVVTLYFTSDRPQTDGLYVALRSKYDDAKGVGDMQDHIPGDWLLPGSRWVPGKIVKDQNLLRYMGEAKGHVTLQVGLLDAKKAVEIVQSSLPVVGDFITLDGGTYVEGSPTLWENWPRP